MILICEQCEKSIEVLSKQYSREVIEIKCSCGARYKIDPAKWDINRIINGGHDLTAQLEQTCSCPLICDDCAKSDWCHWLPDETCEHFFPKGVNP